MEAKEFFVNARREVTIMDFHCLKSAGKELRVKIAARMQIGGGIPPQGMPDWVLKAYEAVVEDKSVMRKAICEVEIEGAAIETYSTPESKGRSQLWNGCDFQQFNVERVGKGDKAGVYLNFVIYTKYTINTTNPEKDTLIWLAKHMHQTSYFAFDATQASFTYPGEEPVKDDKQKPMFDKAGEPAKAEEGDDGKIVGDPNDNPNAPIPGDTRSVTKPGDKPAVKNGNKGAAKKLAVVSKNKK